MPRIQEYLPEEGAAGPQGAMQPNLELATAAGRGLERLGAGIEAGSEAVYQRQTQMEVSDSYANVAQKRAALTEEMQQQINDGTFDTDKFKEQYSDWATKESEKYETAGGRNAFTRQSSRLLGNMLIKGAKGQALIAHNNAVAGFNDTVNGLSAAVRQDPDQFEDAMGSILELSRDKQEAGLLPAKDAAALEDHAISALAKEHILGIADASSATEAIEKLNDPSIAGLLKPNDQDTLRKTLETLEKAEFAEGTRKENLAKKASRAAAEKYASENIDRIASGGVSAKEILLHAPPEVSFSDRVALVKQVEAMGQATQRTSPAAMREIMDRMLLPKSNPLSISDPSTLVKEGINISPQDKKRLHDWYIKTQPGEEEKAAEKMMMNDIKGKLKVPNMPDQGYDNRVINATADFYKTKAKMIKNGEDWTELLDPKSKNYFPLQVRPANPVDVMKAQADAMREGVKSNDIVYTSPGMAEDANKLKDGEVERKTKDGRTAIFDKDKKFVRYK